MSIDARKLVWGLGALLALLAAALGYSLTRPAVEESVAPKTQVAEAPEDNSEEVCASAAAYERVKQQLFTSARGSAGAASPNFEALASYAVVRMENPVVTNRDETAGITSCRGRLVLELPPGAERGFEGKRRLMADVEYTAQGAADGSGLVYTVRGAEPIVQRLAAFNLQGQQVEEPESSPEEIEQADAGEAAEEPAPAPPPVAAPAPPKVEPAPAQVRTSNPSFNCRYARTRSERMVCSSDRLASRDRAMASAYARAMADARPRARQVLLQTRDRFLAYRERCPDARCIEEAYEGRMEEIEDIMEDLN